MISWISEHAEDPADELPALVSNFLIREEELEEHQLSNNKMLNFMSGLLNISGPCWDMAIYNRIIPITCFGVQQLHMGVGHLWMFNSTLITRFYPTILRRIRRAVAEQEAMGWHRIQAMASTLYPNRRRFSIACGLRQESIARAYGCRGEDYYVMAKIVDSLQRQRLSQVKN